jgi:hypothetical protein
MEAILSRANREMSALFLCQPRVIDNNREFTWVIPTPENCTIPKW